MINNAKRGMSSFLAIVLLLCCISFSANAAPNTLDDATKQEYYADYVEIAEKIAGEKEADISVLPMDQFTEEDWRTPEEFRSLITAITDWTITATERTSNSAVSAVKASTITVDGQNYTISITGNFKTHTDTGYQRFGGIDSIESAMTSGGGTWEQTGYECQMIDAGRTYAVVISGELTIAGVKFANRLGYVEFYCDNAGGVK